VDERVIQASASFAAMHHEVSCWWDQFVDPEFELPCSWLFLLHSNDVFQTQGKRCQARANSEIEFDKVKPPPKPVPAKAVWLFVH